MYFVVLKKILDSLIGFFKGNFDGSNFECFHCNSKFNLNVRMEDLQGKLPDDAVFVDFGEALNYCSDKCLKASSSIDRIIKDSLDD